MGDTRLNHLGSILESRNSALRREAAVAFGKYCLSDDKVAEVLLTHICSTSWMDDGNIEDSPISSALQDVDAAFVLKTFNPFLRDVPRPILCQTSACKE
ncbi:hypothetical protein KIN20_015819 [Parelaphostrongylus tenuis]|uniref:Uncharacterized protein n=1 Tax=Parelaphostrongylus tenuis TaxID=148309 RepID=A0AAD5MXU4_PARTN|nr:hypothetical protein KIN20_015819 [Parelaphostrongylus tenuis]